MTLTEIRTEMIYVGRRMAWIKVIEENEAGEALRQAYETVRGARGRVANILNVHSLHPKVLTAHQLLYRELMFGQSELSRQERETIAVAVSVLNHCHY